MTILGTSVTVNINDTSTPKMLCSVIPNLTNVNEGQKVVYTVLTSNVPDYTTLYWNTSGTRVAAGFDDNTTTGTVVIESGRGTIERPIKANYAEDGTTTMDMWISLDQANTSILATTYMPSSFKFMYLIVAGGGSGGWGNGGGGGAGGVLFGEAEAELNKDYPISIGSGGKGINYLTNSNKGVDSTAFSMIAVGGGAGGVNGAGGSGGSGGGGANNDKDLVLWLDAGIIKSYDSISGSSTWNDLTVKKTSYSFSGGTPTYSSIGGGSLVFDGTRSQFAYHDTSLYNSSTTNLYSIYLWVYPIAGGQLVSMNNGFGFDEDGNFYWAGYHYSPMEIDAGGKIRFNQWNGKVGLKSVAQFTAVFNNWYNLVLTYDGNQASAYVNGVLVSSLTNDTAGAPWGAPGTTLYSLMLRDTTASGNIAHPTGRVAIFRAYSRTLSADEVKDNYNSQCERFNLNRI